MTQDEKNRIIELRKAGVGYGEIAKELNLEKNTVRMFCTRNIKSLSDKYCKNCGKKIIQKENGKGKIFCCKKCREQWWNKNRDQSKTKHYFVCLGCNCEFDRGRHKEQKYCSHNCYNLNRSKKVKTNE